MQTRHTQGTRGKNGFTFIEIVIYFALLAAMLVVVVNTSLTISRTAHTVRAYRNLHASALSAMERMTREIRGAKDVDDALGESVFDVHPGRLWLQVVNEFDIAERVEFYLSGGALHMSRAGNGLGNLTADATQVTSIVFREIALATSTAIRIEMEMESRSGSITKRGTFYGTVVLRATYE